MRRPRQDPDTLAPTDLRLALPALAVWAGCLTGLWGGPWWVAGILAILVIGCGGALLARRRARWAAGSVAVIICYSAAAAISLLRLGQAERDPLVIAAQVGSWVTVDVTVAADPTSMRDRFAALRSDPVAADDVAADDAAAGDVTAVDGSRWRLSTRARAAEIAGATVPAGVTVTVIGDGPEWAALIPGQVVRVRGSASPDPFQMLPGVTIRARGSPEPIVEPAWWQRAAAAARHALADAAGTLQDDPGGLLRGFVVGDTRGISERLSADAKTTGLTHLVAVSGTHMAVVGGMVLILLRRFGPRLAAVCSGAAMIAMVILVGPQPSVLRSAVMGFIGIAAVVTGRSRQALPALAAATFGLLLADPTLAVSIGFTLSVQATAALILLAPAWQRALVSRGVPRGPAALVAVPVAAHLATMPVIAGISGTVSLVAIVANIAVAPVVAPALLVGVACLMVAPWWPGGGELLARIDAPLLGWVAGTAHRLAAWPSATVPWPATPAGVLTLAAIVIAGLLLLRHRPARAAVTAMVLGAAVVLIPARIVDPGWPVAGWLLTACDVGQGDGMVLSTGLTGVAVVVDTGPDPAAMDTCLSDLGITVIALVILTHLHADHIGGLDGVLRGRQVAAIGLGPDDSSSSALADIHASAAAGAVPVVELTAGSSWTVGDLMLTVIGPTRSFSGTESDPNNNSVVVMAHHDGVRMLMTGDVERPAQSALLRSGIDLRAEVFKQPHHGSSALLPELLAAVHAQVAVIGVGAGNGYGHPSAVALAEDRAAGIGTILRSDTDGDAQVVLTSSGLATVIRGPSGARRPLAASAR